MFHKEVTHCVLTVPADYEEQKRECIGNAAKKGGFTHISFIDEPVAAAKAWLSEPGKKEGDHIAVCDIGGGTTDFALVRSEGEHCEIVPEVTEGFDKGGNDVDEAILELLLEQDKDNEDQSSEKCRHGFLVKVRKLKEILSRPGPGEVTLSLEGVTFTIGRETVARGAEEFFECVKKRTRQFLERCDSIASNTPVLLVGGGSRLPGLKEAIETLAPNRGVNVESIRLRDRSRSGRTSARAR